MDFTIKTYKSLLQILMEKKYLFLSFQEYIQKKYSIQNSNLSFVILRHDVDRLPQNALRMAQLEAQMNIKSTYFFRVINKTFKPNIIKKIAELGHEIGYHYEVLSKTKGNLESGIKLFQKELQEFKKIINVNTACMHGSPLSNWDSRTLWNKYNIKKFGIIGEPYYDIDFNKILYLTDTGRRWNGSNVNIRDKVCTKFNYNFKTTEQITLAFKNNKLPNQIMMNIHPHRWNDNIFYWLKELIGQNSKNIIKKIILQRKLRLNEG